MSINDDNKLDKWGMAGFATMILASGLIMICIAVALVWWIL